MSLTIGSLFSGIGGLELGLERACVGPVLWQVEQDEFCRRVLARQWPHVARFGDVRAVGANLEKVDLICLGFPCQNISSAGKKEGINGAKSGLWREAARIIRLLRPRYVVVENVAALRSRGLADVLGDLTALGYDAEWSTISACAVGAPHARERLFVVAYSDHQGKPARPVDEEASRLRSYAGRVRHQWQALRGSLRMAHGVPDGMDRLRTLGNAVVPQVAEIVGHVILERESPAPAQTEGGA